MSHGETKCNTNLEQRNIMRSSKRSHMKLSGLHARLYMTKPTKHVSSLDGFLPSQAILSCVQEERMASGSKLGFLEVSLGFKAGEDSKLFGDPQINKALNIKLHQRINGYHHRTACTQVRNRMIQDFTRIARSFRPVQRIEDKACQAWGFLLKKATFYARCISAWKDVLISVGMREEEKHDISTPWLVVDHLYF